MKIRPYEEGDAGDIERLFYMLDDYSSEILPDELKKFEETEDLQKAANSFVKRKSDSNSRKRRIFVAETGKGKIVGFITGSVSREFPGFKISVYGSIEVFFVEERYRGRGIGRKLYGRLEDWFREKKCEAIRVDTWITNEPTIRAYRKMGFGEISVIFVKELKR